MSRQIEPNRVLLFIIVVIAFIAHTNYVYYLYNVLYIKEKILYTLKKTVLFSNVNSVKALKSTFFALNITRKTNKNVTDSFDIK